MEMQSAQIDTLAKALAAAQAELPAAEKNGKNPHLNNRYANITAVYDAIRQALPKHGLAVSQIMLPREDDKAHVRTILMHESGQWLAGECVMPCQQKGPQGMGSAITYARRYSLSAIVGVVSEDDDDAEAAQGKGQQAGQTKTQPRQQAGQKAQTSPPARNDPVPDIDPNAMTAAQSKSLMAYLTKRHGNNRDAYLDELSNFFQRTVASSRELTKADVSEFLDAINTPDNPFGNDNPALQ